MEGECCVRIALLMHLEWFTAIGRFMRWPLQLRSEKEGPEFN